MVFILDQYFSTNRKNTCAILKSEEYSIEQVIELTGFIISVGRTSKLPLGKLNAAEIGTILQQIYGFRDVKENYIRDMEFFEKRIYSKTMLVGFEMCGEYVTWIDIGEADEMYGKRKHHRLIEQNKNHIDEIQDLVKNLKQYA